jgi:hypothetical protein
MVETCTWSYKIKNLMFLTYIWFVVVFVNAVMNLRIPWNTGYFLTFRKPDRFWGRTLLHGMNNVRGCKNWALCYFPEYKIRYISQGTYSFYLCFNPLEILFVALQYSRKSMTNYMIHCLELAAHRSVNPPVNLNARGPSLTYRVILLELCGLYVFSEQN